MARLVRGTHFGDQEKWVARMKAGDDEEWE